MLVQRVADDVQKLDDQTYRHPIIIMDQRDVRMYKFLLVTVLMVIPFALCSAFETRVRVSGEVFTGVNVKIRLKEGSSSANAMHGQKHAFHVGDISGGRKSEFHLSQHAATVTS